MKERNADFSYPLEWISKAEILYDWHAVMDMPDDLYWFCEEPIMDDEDEVVSCGQCGCCITHNKAVYEANAIWDDCDLDYVECPDLPDTAKIAGEKE